MEFKVRKLSDLKVELKIINTAKEVEEVYQAAYKKAQKSLKLHGFRKGKVPPDLLEKHLGDKIRQEAEYRLLRKDMGTCIETIRPRPASLPEMKTEKFERKEGATFVGEYELPPEVKLGKYKKIGVSQDLPKVDAESIKKTLEALQRSRVILHTREEAMEAQMKDILEIDLSIQHEGKNLFEKKKQKFALEEKDLLPGMLENVIGIKTGESRKFQIEVPEDFSDQKYAGKKVDVDLKVYSCAYEELPAIDDEFAKDCGDFESLSELEEKISSQLAKEGERALKKKAQNEMFLELVSGVEIFLPESEIETTIQSILKSYDSSSAGDGPQEAVSVEKIARLMGEKPENLEAKLRETSKILLKHVLVIREIKRREKIKVDKKDLRKALEDRFGPAIFKTTSKEPDVEELMRIIEKQSESEASSIRRQALSEKVLDWLYAHGKINTGKELSISKLVEEKFLDEAVFGRVLGGLSK